MYKKSLLSNGLRVISVPMPQVKSATAMILVGTGSRYETKEINGISHIFEHMVFKGTKTRPDKLAIASIMDSIGGVYNAFTAKEFTGFFIKSASEHLPLTIDLLSDLINNPLLDEKELALEKEVIVEEINMYEDRPQDKVGQYFESLLWGDSPMGRDISGTVASVRGISRSQVADYLKKQYHARSVILVLTGDLPANHLDLAEKNLGDLTKGEDNVFEKVVEKQAKPQVLLRTKKTDQAHLCLGFRGYPIGHPDYYPALSLATILGGNMSSRLFIQIRDKLGLAYDIHTGADFNLDCGSFVTQAGLKLENVQEAIKVILAEHRKMVDEFASDEEIRRCHDYQKGRLVLSMENSYKVAEFYGGKELMEKKLETPEEVIKKIDGVTREDIQRVAEKLFVSGGLNLAMIAPFEDPAPFLSLLEV